MLRAQQSFERSGPSYLTNPNWEDPGHRRSIAASLVHAVRALHVDRNEGRLSPQAETQKWWSFFKFRLRETLVDSDDGCVFGAVFERDGASGPPGEVVAFRGTETEIRSCAHLKDSYTNFNLITNRLHTTSRFRKAMECLRMSINRRGPERVCVAGHSMGAALGLWTGRTLAAEGYKVHAHLFNPPFTSSSSAEDRCEFMEAIVAGFADPNDVREIYDDFLAVGDWVPRVYVNRGDMICSGYVDYFDAYDRMGIAVTRSALLSAGTLLLSALRMKPRPWHVIPSAVQIRSTDVSRFDSHRLSQWWRRHLKTEIRKYSLPCHVRRSSLTAIGLYGTRRLYDVK